MEKTQINNDVKAFVQHGFVRKGSVGDQIFGICPFCSFTEHKHAHTFYVNKKTFDWDCKSCGKSGGFQSFLRATVDFCAGHFKGSTAIELSKSRGLKLSTLRQHNAGFNPVTKKYIIPVPDATGQKFWDLRIYDGKRVISTAGCKVGLLGWESFVADTRDVWLCEGEWDKMALTELQQLVHFDGAIVGVPGAGTFKAEWVGLFKGKNVNALYDNDSAGRDGAEKCHKMLKSATSSLRYLQWDRAEEPFPDKFDVRDYYIRHGSKTLSFILDNLSETPPGMQEVDAVKVGGGTINNALYTGPGLHYEEVYKGYSKWLELTDMQIIDVMFGTVLANRIPGNPVWTFLTGPSGATKSELLLSLSGSPRIISTTTLTVPALVSGANVAGGQDPSLLAILHRMNLVVKDFTTILNAPQIVVEEISAILRDVYDGKLEKRFGNGIYRRYDPCFFGILAGVTEIIEVFTDQHVAFGERFIRYLVEVPDNVEDKRKILRRAMSNTSHEDEMQSYLRKIAEQAINYNYTTIPTIPDDIAEKIRTLAIWTSDMRSTVMRDKYSKEITHRPFTELPTRLAKQFSRLVMGMTQFRWLDVATDVQYQIIKKVARDTAPSRNEEVMQAMYTSDPFADYTIDTISQLINLPSITTQRILEDMVITRMIEKVKRSRMSSAFRISDNAHELIEHAEIYKKPEKKHLKTVIRKGRRI